MNYKFLKYDEQNRVEEYPEKCYPTAPLVNILNTSNFINKLLIRILVYTMD